MQKNYCFVGTSRILVNEETMHLHHKLHEQSAMQYKRV